VYARSVKARPAILLAILIATACADETTGPEPAEFAELCGQEGPVRILALDPDRPLAGVRQWGTFDERRVLLVDYLGEEADPVSPYFDSEPPIGDREMWSVGPCGEDPLLLAENQRPVYWYDSRYPDGWPVLPLSCDETTGQISTRDPTGIRPPNVVFETGDCRPRAIDDGILTIVPNDDEQTGSLILQQWPEDPWTMKAEPVVLLDAVRLPTLMNMLGYFGVTDDEFLVMTANDELVGISRLDGEMTTIATDVHKFEHDSSGRYVVWQGTELTNGDPDWPEGPISFMDRQTNAVTELIEGSLSQTPGSVFALESMGILRLWIASSGVDRFYRIPTLESIDVPGRLFVYETIDDTRAVVTDLSDLSIDGPFWLVDALTGELTMLFDRDGGWVGEDDEGIRVLEGVQCCTTEDANRRAGRLWKVPFDGEPTLLARRATYGHVFTTDGRVVTPIDVGDDWVGSLVVVDPDTLDEQLIDENVLRFESSANEEIDGDPVVRYTVADPERQGVWLARLAD
jgi:hypothetical protein